MGIPEARHAADNSISRWIRRGDAVGVVMGLCQGRETAFKSFGSSGTDRALGPDSLMEIGSITKTFTGALLADMSLRDEVRLDDPIGRYLPGETPRSGDRQITLLDLATHTSRLPRSGRVLIRQALRDRGEPFAAYSISDLYSTLARARIRRGLGQKKSYSNLGFGLLGHVLGLVAARPYEELVVDRICRPLRLTDTTAAIPHSDPRAAKGHRQGARPAPPLRISTLGGAGALRSTAADMLAYLRAVLHPDRTDLADALRLAIGPHRVFRRGRIAIGLGWLHLRRRSTVVWHNGGTVGFGSFVAFDPGRDAGVVLLSNSRYLLRTGRTAMGLLEALTRDER